MKRRLFIKSLIVLPSAAYALPHFFSQNLNKKITGIERPELKGDNFKLLPEAAFAFIKMREEAKKKNIDIYSLSSYRSFEHQKKIWNRKFVKYQSKSLSNSEIIEKITEFSAIPGTSRHHWGTDLDIIDKNYPITGDELIEKNYLSGGKYEKMKRWLDNNANKYGFFEVYTNDKQRSGFEFEPWHFSYQPLAKDILKTYLKIDLVELFRQHPIQGSNLFDSSFLNNYTKDFVLGINKSLI